jgi:hypothetical protein
MAGTRIICMLTLIVEILLIELFGTPLRKLLLRSELKLIDLHGGFEFFAVDGEEALAYGLVLVLDLALFHHRVLLGLAAFHASALLVRGGFLRWGRENIVEDRLRFLVPKLVIQNILKQTHPANHIIKRTVTSIKTGDFIIRLKP